MTPSETLQQAEILTSGSGDQLLSGLKLRLAKQSAPLRWRPHLERLATAAQAGTPLRDAISAQSSAMPRELRFLVKESLNARDPASLLVELLRVRADVREGWREFTSVTIYPGILFLFALGICLAFSFLMQHMIDVQWMEWFGRTDLNVIQTAIQDQHQAILGLSLIAAWILVVLVTIAIAGPRWAWLAVVGGIVLVGKPLRWLTLQEILYRYQLFFEQGVDQAEVPQVVARSFTSSSQSVVAAAIAQRIGDGIPLGRALSTSFLSDGVCRPALLMLDCRSENLSQALEDTAALLGRMTTHRCRTLGAMIPLFVFAVVGTLIWASLSSYAMGLVPLMRMISSLA